MSLHLKSLLVLVALLVGVCLREQEATPAKTATLTLAMASQAKETITMMNQKRLNLEAREVELAALSEALQALKVAKGSEQHVTALERLLKTRTDEYTTAKREYAEKGSEMRDVDILRELDTDPLAFTISPGQVLDASVVINTDGIPRLRVSLIREKSVEFADFTKRNLDKQINLVVNGNVLAQPVVRVPILSGSMELIVVSADAGVALAKALMAK